MAVAGLSVAAVVLYFIPLRYIVLLWGKLLVDPPSISLDDSAHSLQVSTSSLSVSEARTIFLIKKYSISFQEHQLTLNK